MTVNVNYDFAKIKTYIEILQRFLSFLQKFRLCQGTEKKNGIFSVQFNFNFN